MPSRSGVCYDLENSEYKSTQNGLTFVFSSQLYKDKFESRVKENRDIINYSLTKRFGISIDVSTLADVVLYRKIEKRGFLIVAKEDKMQCVKHITYDGANLTLKNSRGR